MVLTKRSAAYGEENVGVRITIKFSWKRSVRTIISGKFQRQIKSCLQISSCSAMHDEKAKKTGEIIFSVTQNLTRELAQFLRDLVTMHVN